MTQLLSLNTQFIDHSSANFTVYSQNFTKGTNLLTGELKKILEPKLFTKQEEFTENSGELCEKSLQDT